MRQVEIHPAPMPGRPSGRLWHERVLGFFAELRPGEGKSALLFFSYAFLLLICYYILKTLREPLLLVGASAEIKSYACAVIALVLLVLVPLYGAVFRRIDAQQLIRGVTLFFVSNLAVFYFLGRAGIDIGFAYYVWAGIFSVAIIAQFWAHAADAYSVTSGQRLFPVIMAGATLGALAGPSLARVLFPLLGPWHLMLVVMALLTATLPLVRWTRGAVPAESRNDGLSVIKTQSPKSLGGFSLVLRDRYLMLLALMVVLLNCINSTGEFILTDFVIRYADEQVAAQPGLDKGKVIAAFYGDFFLVVNAVTLFLQVFVVARILRWIGVHGAVVIVPMIAFIGYGLAVFLPIFGIIRLVKIFENSADYSLMNTARQALYLPLSAAEKFEGKTAIDTFFWRFGDLLQAGVIFAGLHWFGFAYQQFAMLNMVLAGIWIAVAVEIGKHYLGRTAGIARPAKRELSWSLPRCVTARAIGHALGRMHDQLFAFGRGYATVVLMSLMGLITLSVPAASKAEMSSRDAVSRDIDGGLFSEHEPLAMHFYMDMRELCRNPNRKGCEDVPATLVYRDAGGHEQRIEALVRSRGRWRQETGDCSFPALFVFFQDAMTDTLFDGETMLPLTTHCHKNSRKHEQYILKEYLAYRIFNRLTDKSLHVRLLQITYHDTSRSRSEPFVRYGFFTEHFDSLAARNDAEVWKPEQFDVRNADPMDIGTLDLFQYMIGNTDWSVIYGHNIVQIRDGVGSVTPVPYDFDFSGLVNARYATTDPILPIKNVRQRLFRGFCRAETDWNGLFASFEKQQEFVIALLDDASALHTSDREIAKTFLNEFFADISSGSHREEFIVKACRSGRRSERARERE